MNLSLKSLLVTLLSTILATATARGQPQMSDDLKSALGTPVFTSAIDYGKIPDIEGCTPRSARQPLYNYCKDSRAMYDLAVANAKAKKQPLMVVFGFDTCPSCASMHKQVFNPKTPLRNIDIVRFQSRAAVKEYNTKATPFKIPVVFIHSRSEHGLKLADDIGATKMAKARGWHRVWSPFVLFVNPSSGAMHSESYWEAKTVHCHWAADFAAALEGIGMAAIGTPVVERRRCKN